MSEILEWMKEIFKKAKNNDFSWKPIHPNNTPCNGVDGIYTDMFFEKGDKFQYVKYSIRYQPRCDKDGISHPEEGTAFYILHELRIDDLEEKFEIPEPNNNSKWNDPYANMVNNYGRFRYAFGDEETAKSVVAAELIQMIYPYGYILSEKEQGEWNSFVNEYTNL